MPPEAEASEHLRVALVCPYSLSRPGGVQGQVVGLARALARRGHRVTVLAPVDGEVAAPDGVDLVPTGRSVALPANGSVAPVSVSPAAVHRGLAALRGLDADVVHVHEPFAPGLTYGVLAARGLPPVVATFHRSGTSALYGLLRPLARPLTRRLAVRCAVSAAAAATARRAVAGAIVPLFNGVEVDRFAGVEPWPGEGRTVLFLGRHEPRKGLALLLAAGDVLAGRGRPVTLWIAGDGPETEPLRRRHPSSDRVRWLGVLDEEEKVRRLAGADALCAPSLGGESFGLVLLEGLAARTVVVASDISGYREAAGGCAVLVPAGDVAGLADALGDVLDGRRAVPRSAWLDRGTARADGWSMGTLAQRYEELYRAALVGAGR